MAAGPRSLLAFWMGGAGAVPAAVQGGVRSMLAPWIGGASAPPPAAEQAAVRGLLAFWIGGAAAGPAEPPIPPAPAPAGGGRPYRLSIPDELAELRRQRLIEDDELIAAVLIAAMPGLMRRH